MKATRKKIIEQIYEDVLEDADKSEKDKDIFDYYYH